MVSKFFSAFHILSSQTVRRMLLLIPVILFGVFLEALSVGMVIPALGTLTKDNFFQGHAYASQILVKFGNPSHEQLIVIGLIGLAGAFLIKNLYLFFQIQFQGTVVYGAQREMSLNLFNKYLGKPLTFHFQRSSAQLVRNHTSEVLSYCNFFLMPVINLTTEILVISAILGLLLFVEPQGTLFLVIVLCSLIFLFVRSSKRTVRAWGENRLAAEEEKLKYLQQGFRGIKEIILSNNKDYFLSRFHISNKIAGLMNKKEYIFQYVPRLGVEVIAVSSLSGMCLFLLLQGKSHHEVANMLGLMATAGFRLIPSFSRILNNLQSINYGWSSVDALNADYTTDPNKFSLSSNLYDQAVESTSLEYNREIRLSCVSYSYGEGRTCPVLKELSLSIAKGSCIGIKGESGVGKSTLVNLILGLVEPTKGEILVDGSTLCQSNISVWQSKIGYVPQNVYLLDDTLKRNIAFGVNDDEIDDERVLSVIKFAQLESLLTNSSQEADCLVGEEGARLSGGQKQRIGIARALYHDPEVLVLDEATSSLDPSTEKHILHSLKPMVGNKTIVFVAHRGSAFELCSEIYQLDKDKGLCVSSKML